ncbi:unnamed protein product, partial [Durusdinium trenchii]
MGDADGEGDGLTGPDRLKYTEAFNIFDKHQQGYIPWKPDFAKLWRAIGQNPTEAELRRIIEENDTGTGHFQLEACQFGSVFFKDALRKEQLIEAFKTFDKDGKGTLTIAQIRYVMMTMGDPLNDEEADRFIDFADKNKEGPTAEIDYEELVERLDETWKGYFLRNLCGLPFEKFKHCKPLAVGNRDQLQERRSPGAVAIGRLAFTCVGPRHQPPPSQLCFKDETGLLCVGRKEVPLPLAFTAKAETELFDNALPESQAQLYWNFGLKPNIGLQVRKLDRKGRMSDGPVLRACQEQVIPRCFSTTEDFFRERKIQTKLEPWRIPSGKTPEE